MKKLPGVLAVLMMLIALYGFLHINKVDAVIYCDRKNSNYVDFMEIDDMAYLKCYVDVINETDEKTYVRISATADLFDRHTLFAQKELTGYVQDMRSEIHPVEPGQNRLLVYFGAPYGGKYIKGGRLLPWFIKVQEVEPDDPGIAAVSAEMNFGAEAILTSDEIEQGKSSIEFDFDRDGEDEMLSIVSSGNGNIEETADSFNGTTCFRLIDKGVAVDELEISVNERFLNNVMVHDFGFSDGSVELIVNFKSSFTFRINNREVTGEEDMTALIRVADGRLAIDTGTIYGSGGYHFEPAEIQDGKLYSVSGNRVTLERSDAPLRIDLSDALD